MLIHCAVFGGEIALVAAGSNGKFVAQLQQCSGPRVHVRRTGQIKNFRLMNHLLYDKFKRRYLLVGCVGEKSDELLQKLDVVEQQPGWM